MKLWNLYKGYQIAQAVWIRRHPVQYVVLNVGLAAILIGVSEWWDRRQERQLADEVERYVWSTAV